MLFRLIKSYARLAIRLYCRNIIINKPAYLQLKGPLLLAANHPNSFLDGIILTTLFEDRVHSLARGDVFRNPKANRFLRWLGLFPVYRNTEGAEYLGHNYTTFAACIEGFKDNSIVLIFSEGRCENEWHLRPLRKGTARLANSAWEEGIPLTVLPVGINYSSFKKFGKDIHLHFGEPFQRPEEEENFGKNMLAFNEELNKQLQTLVYEIPPGDKAKLHSYFHAPVPAWKKLLLFLPAVAGWILHLPLFLPVKAYTDRRFSKSGHYDSVISTGMMVLYPLYILLFCGLLLFINPWLALAAIFILPFTAWSYAQTMFTKI